MSATTRSGLDSGRTARRVRGTDGMLPLRRCTLPTLAVWLALAAVSPIAQGAANSVACPERIRTMAATSADPTRIAGFAPIFGGQHSAQAFLQDVEIHTGSAFPGTGERCAAWQEVHRLVFRRRSRGLRILPLRGRDPAHAFARSTETMHCSHSAQQRLPGECWRLGVG